MHRQVDAPVSISRCLGDEAGQCLAAAAEVLARLFRLEEPPPILLGFDEKPDRVVTLVPYTKKGPIDSVPKHRLDHRTNKRSAQI